MAFLARVKAFFARKPREASTAIERPRSSWGARVASVLGFVVASKGAPRDAYRGGSAMPELPLYQQMQRIGGNLTPAQVSNIIREADLGRMWRLMDLANESRQRDCHLQSVLQTRELAVSGLEWQVVARLPAGAKQPKLRATKIAQWVQEKLRAAEGFSTLLQHLIGGKYYGYSVAETLWKRDEDGSVVPGAFKAHAPRRFIFDMMTGALLWCDLSSGMTLPGVDLKAEFPDRFIIFQPRVNGDVPCREGLVRVLMWAALFRNWDLRDWLTLAELAWKPWRTGAYEKGAEDKDIANLEAVLEGMSANGVAVYPKTTEIKVEWPKNSTNGTSAHKELYDTLGADMSKAVLGQTLTTEQGAKGSQALGRVHNDVRRDILEADARDIEALLERDVIGPMVRWEFGENAEIPRLQLITDDSADIEKVAIALDKLCGPNVRLKVTQKHVRDECGIPEPDEGEELCGPGPDDEDDEEPKDGKDPDGDKPKDEEKPEKLAA